MSPIHRSVDGRPGNAKDRPGDELSSLGSASTLSVRPSSAAATVLQREHEFPSSLRMNVPLHSWSTLNYFLDAGPRGLRFVRSRQRFVRRCHGRKRPQPNGRPGQVKQSGSTLIFGPSYCRTLLAYIRRQLLVRVIFWTRAAGPSAFKGQRPRQGQSMRYAAPCVSGDHIN